jgi:hypothetical protein
LWFVADEAQAVVILDPSVLFTDEALGWLEDPELAPFLAVSRALWEQLEDPEIGWQFAPWGTRPDPDRVSRVRQALEPITKFSHTDVDELPGDADSVRNRLLDSDDPFRHVLADEWAFLASHSLAVLARNATRTLRRFARAGAHVYAATREEMERGLEAIRDMLPPRVLEVMKYVGKGPSGFGGKLIVAGGGYALAMIPHVGGALQIASYVQQGIGAIAGDP